MFRWIERLCPWWRRPKGTLEQRTVSVTRNWLTGDFADYCEWSAETGFSIHPGLLDDAVRAARDSNELYDWMAENIRYGWRWSYDRDKGLCIVFNDLSEALHYKLRWYEP